MTILQHSGHVLPSVDREMAWPLEAELAADGIDVRLNAELAGFRKEEGGVLFAQLNDGTELATDLVVMSVGVKPNSELAAAAGLELGPRGHIVVDEHLRTSDPDIYAAGDVVEVVDRISGQKTAIPLAGPANKQGRIVADNIAGKPSVYRGSWGASVIKIGSLTAASIGLTEKKLQSLGVKYHRIYTHPASNSYYPGGAQLHLKLLFDLDGKILGAQAVGAKGADKRLDVIGAAMQSGRTAPELAELELAYAPPYNSAKDPVNYLGMIAQNVLDGTTELAYADAIPADALLIDVREEAEHQAGAIPGAINMPLGTIRRRLNELDRSKELIVSCQVGLRGYLAERILKQNGFRVRNLSGGYLTWKYTHAPLPPVNRKSAAPVQPAAPAAHSAGTERKVDVRTLACPGPIVRLKGEMEKLAPGETLRLLAAASFAPDLEAWSRSSGSEVASLEKQGDQLEAVIRKGGVSVESTAAPAAASGGDSAAIVLFSNDLDKAMAALIIACGMAASGAKVGIFFTFWGLSVLRKNPAPAVKKNLVSRLFGWMLPCGASKLALSKMNMAGLGSAMMKRVMKQQNVTSLPDLLRQARELGVKFVACEMAMNVMGISREELIEVDEVAGVASFAAMAKASSTTLFI